MKNRGYIVIVCCKCYKVLGETPSDIPGISHGLCRYHALESLAEANVIEPWEQEEFERLKKNGYETQDRI